MINYTNAIDALKKTFPEMLPELVLFENAPTLAFSALAGFVIKKMDVADTEFVRRAALFLMRYQIILK